MHVERVGSWSIDKLDILENYFKPYATIMTAQKQSRGNRRAWLSEFYYIDAFAGPGAVALKNAGAEEPEAEQYLAGSPVRALDCRPPFDHLWFVDKNTARGDALKSLLKERGEIRRATVEIGDCNDRLAHIIKNLRPADRALAFLDPYGLELDWATIQSLAKTRRLDVFINFSLMGITRNLPRGQSPSADVFGRLERVMAASASAWVQNLYSVTTDMFGREFVEREQIVAEQLATRYASDLEGAFGYASDPIIMTNSRGGPLYALILASHNRTAVNIMNDISARKRKRAGQQQTKSSRAPSPERPRLFDLS